MNAGESGAYAPVMANPPAPHVPPPAPNTEGLWWRLALFLAPVVFAAGGAWVQITSVEAQVRALESRLDAHRLEGHPATRSRVDLIEQRTAELAAERAATAGQLDQKLEVIRDNLAALCAAQRPNPCRRSVP